jgi:hypothetical protein
MILPEGSVPITDRGLLREILKELRKLNAVFECRNFLEVPGLLREIRENTRLGGEKSKPPREKASQGIVTPDGRSPISK